jgi:hypothetical protein
VNLITQNRYGAGQFWNTYNINLPLDTLALVGALLEWSHEPEAIQYMSWFFKQNIDPADGSILYKNFGCDSDADYGRILDTFVLTVRYSGNVSWAQSLLPSVTAIASRIMSKRASAVARCAFFDRNLHSRMPLVPTPARLKRAGV